MINLTNSNYEKQRLTFGINARTKDIIRSVTGTGNAAKIEGVYKLYESMTQAAIPRPIKTKLSYHTPIGVIEIGVIKASSMFIAIDEQCKEALMKQFDFLQKIVHSCNKHNIKKKGKAHLNKWLNSQVARIGTKELDVPEITLDRVKLNADIQRIKTSTN